MFLQTMHLKKIISGGQTGADQAALDAAIKAGVPHGGWIPKGRLTEEGRLPDKYRLKEMPTGDYPKRTEQNILDSDGTVIFSHGKLTGGSKLTQRLANKHERPCLHINLDDSLFVKRATDLYEWILRNKVETLNVAGSRASKDPEIYVDVFYTILNVLMLDVQDAEPGDSLEGFDPDKLPVFPKTVSEAVDRLIDHLMLKDKVKIARMSQDEIPELHLSIGQWVRNNFGFYKGNRDLIESCWEDYGEWTLDVDGVSLVIVTRVWERLQGTHGLRAVESG